MNNFSDLQVIDRYLTVGISLQPIFDADPPWVCLMCNGQVILDAPLYQSFVIDQFLPLLDPVTVSVTLKDKHYRQGQETAVLIERLCLDTIDIIPGFTHLATYDNDHLVTGATNYLGFNGTWKWATNQPFYQWHHRVTGQGWLLQPTIGSRD